MPVLTDILSIQIKDSVTKTYGRVLTRPALLVSDGISTTYACDVDIAQYDPTGQIDQYNRDVLGLPTSDDWKLEDTLTHNTVLHNVLIARGNADLIYADIGAPVELTRKPHGQWEVTGFSVEQPGTYTLVPVNLGDLTIGTVIDMSIDARLLTLGELGILRPFGELPFGGSGIFVGGTLLRIV